jgi:hypothetical protein
MIEYRDLAALMIPRVGSLEATGDPWEPWRLCDPAGAVVAPVAAYLRDLQASGRPETTLRTYSIALRGLSNNGTASGDSELKTARLPPLAVRISKSVGGHQDLPAGGHQDGNGYHRE